jgi:cation transport regulator
MEDAMPYASNADLPESVKHVLPPHAQDTFREAFNHALDEYGREENAFRVAWSAVKKGYRKEGDRWVAKE